MTGNSSNNLIPNEINNKKETKAEFRSKNFTLITTSLKFYIFSMFRFNKIMATVDSTNDRVDDENESAQKKLGTRCLFMFCCC